MDERLNESHIFPEPVINNCLNFDAFFDRDLLEKGCDIWLQIDGEVKCGGFINVVPLISLRLPEHYLLFLGMESP